MSDERTDDILDALARIEDTLSDIAMALSTISSRDYSFLEAVVYDISTAIERMAPRAPIATNGGTEA